MKALVVIPTFNERHNIGRIVPLVLEQDPELHVLVVDDNSPDGTAEVVKSMQIAEPRVHLMEREGKMGLGTAYIAGFQWALAEVQFFPGPGAVPPGIMAADPGPGSTGDRRLAGDPGQHLIAPT